MKWEIDEKLPIHSQIVDEIIKRVVNKEYLPGQRIPSVRELSVEAKVNPNTMQKALQELEERKIIYTQRTSGKFITENEVVIENLKRESSNELVNKFIKDMTSLRIYRKRDYKYIGKEKVMIELKNVSKKYGDIEALTKVNLTLKENKIIGLLGINRKW